MRIATILLLLTTPAAAGAPEPLAEMRSGNVVVRHIASDARMAEQVVGSVARVRQAIRDDLGIAFREPAVIVLARGRKAFERHAGAGVPGWALAIAHTERRGIVIDVSRTGPLLENNLLFTLHHELVHLALGQAEAEAGARLPLWFHEGVATRVSGTAHFTDRRALLIAGAHGALKPFAELADGFPSDAAEAQLAYLQSEHFIAWLVDHGVRLADVVATFRKEGDLHTALRRASGRPFEALEADWRASLVSPHPWLTTLYHALSLMTILALLTILAYILLRIRRARHAAREADEEAWMDSLPDSEWGEEE